jgi:predicted CoA-substrate-specific enzyme activase
MKEKSEKPHSSSQARHSAPNNQAGGERFIGIDIGAETIKIVELQREGHGLKWRRSQLLEHGKDPGAKLLELLQDWDWTAAQGAAVTGRLARQIKLQKVPLKQAQVQGYRYFFDGRPGTVVSIGSHGFSVLELRANGTEIFRENNRCSQGTGNFLRQLVERFGLTIDQASELCSQVDQSAPLSGRCPVILKTDMTHLANKGEDRARILAGLFDAVCENVMVLLKPGRSPSPVSLIGGVSRSPRVQKVFGEILARNKMEMAPLDGNQALFLEALGCAVLASRRPEGVPPLSILMAPPSPARQEKLPALSKYLHLVNRMPSQRLFLPEQERPELILGFDIGSTGSKVIALNIATREAVWEGYIRTGGNPVEASQNLMRQFVASPAGRCPVTVLGVTGSGREIVGSLMAACYGPQAVYILNEIAAHATGALHYDARVDTIFEIGGQDAKYIRLAEGRVVDCAMNEACSAGTGSFIEEQGSKFKGIKDVVHLGVEALAASEGISLGQHCSVFMAEVIDASVASGVDQRTIIAGLYDSIIQNYLNRVKGNRSVGHVIFCQGMPFSSDALAAAVARQTGSQVIIPPNPGTVGALGIALLAHRELPRQNLPAIQPESFLSARVEQKDHFSCKSTTGCGGQGNRCRIDRLTTFVNEQTQKFTWGGGCALYDKGTRKKKLPNLAPDPFREREAWIQNLLEGCATKAGAPEIAIADEFMLKGLFTFFAVFLSELGFNLKVPSGANQVALKRGIQESNVPYCAPMQLFHGLVSKMADEPGYLFLPMIRSLPKMDGEKHSATCPIVQASADILKCDLGLASSGRIISPVIEVGDENLSSLEFLKICQELATQLGRGGADWRAAHQKALIAQQKFEAACLEIGTRALAFCAENEVIPVVVAGRPYTIYNTVLNSNVPAILREQGAMGIPIDCYPIDSDTPVFHDMYWGYGQRILRAAHQVRRTPGIYSLYCSNYSCGPDSFNLHFYSYIMEGKPFAIIETDGHAGDAGTKTRVEAFLHCVAQDLQGVARQNSVNEFDEVQVKPMNLESIRQRGEVLLVPYMGPGSIAVATSVRSLGIKAEALPPTDADALRIGRRYTSGKECLPMCLTLGNLLKRIDADASQAERFALLMPGTTGPCRFGIYNLLNQITLDKLEYKDRVRIWSPMDADYFNDTPPGWAILTFAGIIAVDMLLDALLYVRPAETRAGAAEEIYRRYTQELIERLQTQGHLIRSLPASLWQAAGGEFFGIAKMLKRAAAEYAAVLGPAKLPTVLMVGEIYVRCDPFANDFVIEKLEHRGLRMKLAPLNEWLEYSDSCGQQDGKQRGLGAGLRRMIKSRILNDFHQVFARALGWPARVTVHEAMHAAGPYIREDLRGEAVLTLGSPLHEWREKMIDAVISVGPLECMPNKIAEAQFFHVAEKDGLLNLTLSLNGDTIDPEVLDNFAFEVHSRYQARQAPRAEPVLAR